MKGPHAQNDVMMDTGWDVVGSMNPPGPLSISNCTLVNDLGPATIGINQGSPGSTLQVSGMKLWGMTAAQLVSPISSTTGPANVTGTTILQARPILDTSSPVQ